MKTEQKIFNELIQTIVDNNENNIATISNVKLWAESWQKEMKLALTLTDVVSSLPSECQENWQSNYYCTLSGKCQKCDK